VRLIKQILRNLSWLKHFSIYEMRLFEWMQKYDGIVNQEIRLVEKDLVALGVLIADEEQLIDPKNRYVNFNDIFGICLESQVTLTDEQKADLHQALSRLQSEDGFLNLPEFFLLATKRTAIYNSQNFVFLYEDCVDTDNLYEVTDLKQNLLPNPKSYGSLSEGGPACQVQKSESHSQLTSASYLERILAEKLDEDTTHLTKE